MFIIKDYILWQRTITQIVPVHELFALDRLDKCFLYARLKNGHIMLYPLAGVVGWCDGAG